MPKGSASSRPRGGTKDSGSRHHLLLRLGFIANALIPLCAARLVPLACGDYLDSFNRFRIHGFL